MHKRSKFIRLRLMSFILALVMVFSNIITVFAGNVSSAIPGGGAFGNGAMSGSTWSYNSQFMRVSLYWAPKAPAGTPGVGEDGADWNSPEVKDLGTVDWAYADGYNPAANPVWHSSFMDAVDYYNRGNVDSMATWASYFVNPSKVYLSGDYYQDANGNTMKFPRPVGNTKNSTTDVKYFFKQYSVLNDVLWMLKASQGLPALSGVPGLAGLQVWMLEAGIYIDTDGTYRNGTYLLTVEPGIYMPVAGEYTAITMRDMINLSSYTGLPIWRKAPSIGAYLAQSLVLEPNMNYPQLGLSYQTPLDSMDGSYAKNSANHDRMRQSYGIGAFMWWSDIEPIPVVNYYYDLDEEDFTSVGLKIEYETDEKTGEKTAKVVDSEGNQITTYDLMYEYGEIFARKADNAKKISNTNTEYTAKADDGGYQLVSGYMTNKEVVAGNLDIKNNSLGFYDINGAANITEQLKNHTGIADLSEEKVKEWHTSQNFATTVLSNQAVSGLSKLRHIEQDTDGGLTASFGNGIDSLQAVFLGIYYG